MKKTSKFLSVFLAILMVISIIPITASATTYSGTCGYNLVWELDESVGTLTISGTGAMEDFTYNDEESSSSAPWFDYKKSIKEIVITDGITTIGDYAFYYCKNLEKVSIPESVVSIGGVAFGMCDKLKAINIPDTVTTIKGGTFMCSGLTEVIFPKNLTTITAASFRNCPYLSKVTIPDTITAIETHAFAYCTSLQSITIPKSITSLGESAFEGCSGLKKVEILANITEIEDFTFFECRNLDELTIPKSVTVSGLYAFTYCSDVSNIYYSGTEEEWNQIKFNDMWFGKPFGGPTMHYNCCLHEYNAAVTTPTCTEQGYTTYTCTICEDTFTDNYVDALGHTECTIFAEAPSCTETGLTEGAKCSVCGEILTEQKTVDALGHTPSIPVEENYVAPTCTENGSKDVVAYCSLCEEEIRRETVIINATGHNYTTEVKNPTCTEQGYTTYTCECGETCIDDYVNATGHTDNDGDGYCDVCDFQICDHRCHKPDFIWIIINFFNKFFGLNKTCECGVVHY